MAIVYQINDHGFSLFGVYSLVLSDDKCFERNIIQHYLGFNDEIAESTSLRIMKTKTKCFASVENLVDMWILS